MRHEDELEKLGKFFIGYPVKVLVYFRYKESFLDSYKKQLIKMGIHTSSIQGEFNYVESDSRLTNYCELVKAFELQFGVDSVQEMQYEREVLNDGSIVPSFLRKISCNDASSLGDIQKWLNVT